MLASGVRQGQLLRDLHMLPRQINLRRDMQHVNTSASTAGCRPSGLICQARSRTPVPGDLCACIERWQVTITLRSALLMVIARGVDPATALRQQARKATVRPTYDARMVSQRRFRGGRCHCVVGPGHG